MGQTNLKGHYPFHLHVVGNHGNKSYIEDSSIHHSFFKAVVIHGSKGSRASRNVAFDVTGSAFYLQDGVEEAGVAEVAKPAADGWDIVVDVPSQIDGLERGERGIVRPRAHRIARRGSRRGSSLGRQRRLVACTGTRAREISRRRGSRCLLPRRESRRVACRGRRRGRRRGSFEHITFPAGPCPFLTPTLAVRPRKSFPREISRGTLSPRLARVAGLSRWRSRDLLNTQGHTSSLFAYRSIDGAADTVVRCALTSGRRLTTFCAAGSLPPVMEIEQSR